MSNGLIYLLDSWRWFGRHTGYGRLVETMATDGVAPQLITSAHGAPLNALANRLYAVSHNGAWCCAGRDRHSETTFVERWQQQRSAVGHILYFERHHPVFGRWRRAPENLIATIHHPPNQMREWHSAVVEDLRRLSSAIVLYQRDLEFFERCVGRDRVKFVRHGVDTDFFHPQPLDAGERERRILFVGVNGRNLSMLTRVIQSLSRLHPDLRFDILVPRFRQKPREALRLASLWYNPNVTWHAGIGDEQLRRLYQQSYLLLLPLQYAGVCNAVVEAMACGLPVVTTDVGGIRDYGGGTVYPLVADDDDQGMISLVKDYLASPEWRAEIGARCRAHAETTLSWSSCRQAHLDAYDALLN